MSSFQVDSLFSVKGKVALVTGGSRGIGKMIATGFIKNGAKVYITSRSAQDCAATEKELNALGPGQCIAIPADIQKLEEADRLVKELGANEKALHILVNNAGAAWGDTIDDYPDAAWTELLTLNLQRVFTITQKCLPLLRAAAEEGGLDGNVYRDPARIINIGSVLGLTVPGHETYAYSASKAGLHHLSRNFAGRLGFEGITSNALACGPFESKMMEDSLREQGEIIKASIPLGRIGTPEDVAGAAIFLSSRAGAFINGATISVDGGSILYPHTELYRESFPNVEIIIEQCRVTQVNRDQLDLDYLATRYLADSFPSLNLKLISIHAPYYTYGEVFSFSSIDI